MGRRSRLVRGWALDDLVKKELSVIMAELVADRKEGLWLEGGGIMEVGRES
jgi:hypothetical protein